MRDSVQRLHIVAATLRTCLPELRGQVQEDIAWAERELRAVMKADVAPSQPLPEWLRTDGLVIQGRCAAVPLSSTEFAILAALARQRGAYLRRERLSAAGNGCSDDTLRVIVSRIRSKMRRADVPDMIGTRYGEGYVLDSAQVLLGQLPAVALPSGASRTPASGLVLGRKARAAAAQQVAP